MSHAISYKLLNVRLRKMDEIGLALAEGCHCILQRQPVKQPHLVQGNTMFTQSVLEGSPGHGRESYWNHVSAPKALPAEFLLRLAAQHKEAVPGVYLGKVGWNHLCAAVQGNDAPHDAALHNV